jgi:hypothetical protein
MYGASKSVGAIHAVAPKSGWGFFSSLLGGTSTMVVSKGRCRAITRWHIGRRMWVTASGKSARRGGGSKAAVLTADCAWVSHGNGGIRSTRQPAKSPILRRSWTAQTHREVSVILHAAYHGMATPPSATHFGAAICMESEKAINSASRWTIDRP